MSAFPVTWFDGRRVSDGSARAFSMIVFGLAALVAGFIWLLGSTNPYTPAGYVGYLTRGAVFGRSTFYGVQRAQRPRAGRGSSTSPMSASRRTPTTRTSLATKRC